MLDTTLKMTEQSTKLNRNFPPNNPSALSIFNYRLGLFYLTDCRQGAVSCQWSMRTGSKQSCVNCVQIFDCINLRHNNLIDFDSPKINKLHVHYATEHALVLIDEKIISSRKFFMIN